MFLGLMNLSSALDVQILFIVSVCIYYKRITFKINSYIINAIIHEATYSTKLAFPVRLYLNMEAFEKCNIDTQDELFSLVEKA